MRDNQFVVFKLGKSEFGIHIMNVKEIRVHEETTLLPNTPAFIEGVINCRGSVIPVINLKRRLNLGNTEMSKDTRIIVVNVDEKEIGFIVDEASQTIHISSDRIDPAPSGVVNIDQKYITGIGKIDEKRLLIIVDLMKILTEKEMDEITQMNL